MFLGIFFIILAIGLVGFQLFIVLFSITYQYFIYPYFIRSRFDSSWLPRCSIILPNKGIPKNGKKNFSSFLSLDYPDYEIIYVLEDENDPGVTLIKSLIKNHKHAKLVIAGHTKNCAQKTIIYSLVLLLLIMQKYTYLPITIFHLHRNGCEHLFCHYQAIKFM